MTMKQSGGQRKEIEVPQGLVLEPVFFIVMYYSLKHYMMYLLNTLPYSQLLIMTSVWTYRQRCLRVGIATGIRSGGQQDAGSLAPVLPVLLTHAAILVNSRPQPENDGFNMGRIILRHLTSSLNLCTWILCDFLGSLHCSNAECFTRVQVW